LYEKFRQILVKKGITPYKVSKDTGISTATLSDWKNGKTKPKTDKLLILAEYLSVDIKDLL
jgi:transcriptional regulator with XRE-family HTH domain